MRRSDFDGLVPGLACPNCYGDLLPEDMNNGSEVLSGRLRCAGCAASYPIHESVLFLVVPDVSWRPILQEVVSWKSYEFEQEFLRRRGMIPEGPSMAESHGSEKEKERDIKFEEVLAKLEIKQGDRACEVAAFKCQQALSLLERGAHVVATDAWMEPLIYGPGGEGECRLLPKICCNADRLPFKKDTFDLTCIRTAIHHFDRPIRAMREMGRVTRPGGKVVLVNEPSNYMFGRSDSERVLSADPIFIMGFNESTPCFSTYLAGLRLAGLRNLVIDYFDVSLPPFLVQALSVLGVTPDRFLGSWYCGKTTRGLKMLKLLPVHCGISVVAEKGPAFIPDPEPVPDDRLCFSVDELLDRSLENLAKLWKRTLLPRDVPRSITVGGNDLYHLRRGWEKPENIFGRPTRWTHFIAYAFLRNTPGDDALEIECQAPITRLGGPLRGEVSVDGGPWLGFCLRADGMERLFFDLPAAAGEVVEIRIRTPEPWRGSDLYPGRYDERLYFGFAVRAIRIGRKERLT